jgi:hypothetical protein
VETALASRLLPAAPAAGAAAVLGFANGSSTALADGDYTLPPGTGVAWLAAGGVGYVPFVLGDDGGMSVSVGTRTGNWSSIGAFSGVSTNRLLAASLAHNNAAGGATASAAYAYAILPAVSASAVPAAAASLAGVPRSCVVNSAAVQGAAQPPAAGAGGVAQVVFWAADGGTFACADAASGWALTVSSPAPAIVLVRELAGAVAVSAAHPTAGAGAAKITVSRAVAAGSPGCAAAGAQATTFTLQYPTAGEMRGSTVTVTCAL